MEDSEKKRKKPLNYRGSSAKKKRNFGLECGMKGFLCTTNFREKECVREAYNILNEFLEKLEKPNDALVSIFEILHFSVSKFYQFFFSEK